MRDNAVIKILTQQEDHEPRPSKLKRKIEN